MDIVFKLIVTIILTMLILGFFGFLLELLEKII